MNGRFLTAGFVVTTALMASSLLSAPKRPSRLGVDEKTKADTAAAVVEPARPGIDPDKAYKAHCSACHTEPRRYSDRATVTIIQHMRVRANLTAAEEKAIIEYLTR